MAEAAKARLSSIAAQLIPNSTQEPEGETDQLSPIKHIAGLSSGQRLIGKVAIITGANSILGIGRAAAHQFAENGAQAIYMCDFDNTYLEAHKREITQLYPNVQVHIRKFDAADENAVKEVIDHAIQTYGRLDVMFANAGTVGSNLSFLDVDVEDWEQTFKVNTLGPFLAAKHAAPAMKFTTKTKTNPGGSIIMTASVAGLRANAGSTPYSASKAAVISMAQTMSYTLANTGVRVNAICPGLIETGMTEPLFVAARARGSERKVGQLNPLKRAGHADEIARVALFLASDESSYVNGQAWTVCGGLSAGHPYVDRPS